MNITTGSVIRAEFPFLDKPGQSKTRYGVVISDDEFHNLFQKKRYMVAYMSSAKHSYILEDWEFVVKEGSEIFAQSGLSKTTIIKVHRLYPIQEDTVKSVVGTIPISLVLEIRNKAIKKMFAIS